MLDLEMAAWVPKKAECVAVSVGRNVHRCTRHLGAVHGTSGGLGPNMIPRGVGLQIEVRATQVQGVTISITGSGGFDTFGSEEEISRETRDDIVVMVHIHAYGLRSWCRGETYGLITCMTRVGFRCWSVMALEPSV